MKKILVLGAGAMGSAFTVPCVDNKNNVIFHLSPLFLCLIFFCFTNPNFVLHYYQTITNQDYFFRDIKY